MPRSTAEIDGILAASWADAALSRSERRALEHELRGAAGAPELALWRDRAFEIARAEVAREPVRALEWLEEFVRALTAASDPDQPAERPEALACFSPGEDCLRQIILRLDRARRSVDVCVFTITDDRITRAIEAAHRRGVAVRIITDDEKARDRGSDIRRLRSEGIAVCTDCVPGHMHHKFALFDQTWLLNGSYNWTRGAASENVENLIATTDPRLVDRFGAEFEGLWRRLS